MAYFDWVHKSGIKVRGVLCDERRSGLLRAKCASGDRFQTYVAHILVCGYHSALGGEEPEAPCIEEDRKK